MITDIILPDQQVKIEQQWPGIMVFGPDKQPICKPVSDRVAIGSKLGQQLAELLLE